ncbi:MAG: COGs COG2929 [uncultured Campylobacterales bacterium]|uniref:COGs COG2929 n=1 Tax=uncultured Campylobacterales bacterium TaxID=352960 RepID=A0A6S6T3B8_9BACT|nr:MAG: COGs COG2929 [uncultured Campylobacterales bacterium]
MDFEYDINKSKQNKEKHNIDFEEAKLLWNDYNLIELPSKNNDNLENRFLLIGKIEKNYYTSIVTYRKEIIRIISVRRSRKKEIELYEKNR